MCSVVGEEDRRAIWRVVVVEQSGEGVEVGTMNWGGGQGVLGGQCSSMLYSEFGSSFPTYWYSSRGRICARLTSGVGVWAPVARSTEGDIVRWLGRVVAL